MTSDELADAWEAAWSGRRSEVFVDVCAADIHYEDPLTSAPLHGSAQLSEHALRLWTALPDVRLERAGERLTRGSALAIPSRLVGTHTGEVEGLPPSGRFLAIHVVFWCEQADGRLRRVRAFVDLYDAAVQLGVLPERGSLSERALMMVRGFGWKRS